MLKVLSTTALSLWSKARVWLLLSATAVVALVGLATALVRSGKKSERMEQAERTINTYKKEAQIEADVRSLGADAARERLRSKWRKR